MMEKNAPQNLAGIARGKLAEHLQGIFDSELQRGNEVCRIDEPAGTRCPLAVVFRLPLHKRDMHDDKNLRWSEVRDPHYEPVPTGGYFCEKTRQFIYGPISGRYPT